MCLSTVEEILWMCTREDVGRDGMRRYKVNFQFAVMAQTRRDLNLCNRPHRTVREEVVLTKLAPSPERGFSYNVAMTPL